MRRPVLALFLLVQACSGNETSWSEGTAGAGRPATAGGAAGRDPGPSTGGSALGGSALGGSGSEQSGAGGAAAGHGGSGSGGATTSDAGPPFPFAPPAGKTALLVGQSGRRAHLDYVLGTASEPAGGSVYAELYSGKFLSFEQAAFVDYLARYYPGSLVEVGLSWKDNRVNAGYCDLAEPACATQGGAIAPELDVLAGKYDAALAAFGETLRAYAGLKFLVRVDYEVSPGQHCAPTDQAACPAYTKTFRYLKKLWEAAGISNIALVFHPTRGWAQQMYPGDDVTDWIAFSVFNHDLCLPTPEGSNGGCKAGAHLDQNLAADFAWAARQGKPILIAEATVQNPSDATPAGFNEYLSRLFEIVDQYPQVRGLTYINMKWSGGWIYGEDWTTGAFGHVDARLARFPQTRQFFCQKLDQGRFVDRTGAPLGCDAPNVKAVTPPPDQDLPAFERLLLLGTNRCARTHDAGAIVQSDCAALSLSGQARFHFAEKGARTQIWSDVSWQCWAAAGNAVVEQACSDAPEQGFAVEPRGSGEAFRDVRLVARDGRCVGVAADAPADAPLRLAACDDSPLQTFRL